jgi:hypothetical protein
VEEELPLPAPAPAPPDEVCKRDKASLDQFPCGAGALPGLMASSTCSAAVEGTAVARASACERGRIKMEEEEEDEDKEEAVGTATDADDDEEVAAAAARERVVGAAFPADDGCPLSCGINIPAGGGRHPTMAATRRLVPPASEDGPRAPPPSPAGNVSASSPRAKAASPSNSSSGASGFTESAAPEAARG